MHRVGRIAAVFLLLLLLTAGMVLGSRNDKFRDLLARSFSADIDRPNVIILSLESFRSGHMGLAGYHRPVTPLLDELAAGGVFFQRAYSQASWTRPSVASTFTSTYMGVHRVNGDPPEDVARKSRWAEHTAPKVSDDFQTMAEVFQAEGYRTVGWNCTPQLWEGLGFGQGFDEYSSEVWDEEIVKRLLEVLGEDGGKPLFTFAHLCGTHWPFEPAERFRKYDDYPDGVNITADTWEKINEGEITLSPEDIAHNLALYDGEILAIDERVGRILEVLGRQKKADRTIVVVMSDHGEAFGENGMVGHGKNVREEVIHVPLIMRGPGIPEGLVVLSQVQNIDIYPTLSELIFGKVPDGLQGNSLLALFEDDPGAPWHPAFSEHWPWYTVILGRWKYMIRTSSGEEFLFDLEEVQPGNRNLIDNPAHRNVAADLRGRMKNFLDANGAIARERGFLSYARMPEDKIRKLKALGYLR